MNVPVEEAVRRQLEQELAQLNDVANQTREKLELVESRASRFRAAIAGLDGVSVEDKPEVKRKSMNPSASKTQVIALIADELSKQNGIAINALKSQIEMQLLDSGHSRIGFSLRFKEACRSSRFIERDGALYLADSKQLETSTTAVGRSSTAQSSSLVAPSAISQSTRKLETPAHAK